jgi:hypothetical protein
MPGFRTTIGFVKNGVPATCSLYFLFDGRMEYQLILQAATENWETKQPAFRALLSSFRLE